MPGAWEQALQCPDCKGAVDVQPGQITCRNCGRRLKTKPFLDACTQGFRSPRGLAPAMMQTRLLARVYDRLWRPLYMSLISRGRPDFDREFVHIRKRLEPAAGDLLVDLSCGPGMMGRRLGREGAFPCVVGVDLSEAMLNECHRANIEAGLTDFPLIRADVTDLPLKTGSVGGVHAGAALHLWPDVQGALREAHRVLKPGGVFVGTTLIYSRHRLPRQMERVFGWTVQTRFFRDNELVNALCRAGFKDVQLTRWSSLGMISAHS